MARIIKLVILFGLIALSISSMNFWRGVKTPLDPGAGKTEFIITPGEGVKEIGANLEKHGLIGSGRYFEWYIALVGKQQNLIAGSYSLSSAQSIKEMAAIFIGGEAEDREMTIKTIEGWDIAEINDYFVKGGVSTGNKFLELANSPIDTWLTSYGTSSADVGFLRELSGEATLEGFLFPDTYRIFKDAAEDEIILKMLKNFDIKITPDLRQEISRQSKSLFEVITLASIVEKEVSVANDRKIVAGIFWRRLAVGMPLQADSTVNYITGKKTPAVSLADTDIDSLYNTYKYRGLPPGPICNPGLDSILAAIYPEASEYWYFLNRADNGATVFSITFAEHVANKNKYLK